MHNIKYFCIFVELKGWRSGRKPAASTEGESGKAPATMQRRNATGPGPRNATPGTANAGRSSLKHWPEKATTHDTPRPPQGDTRGPAADFLGPHTLNLFSLQQKNNKKMNTRQEALMEVARAANRLAVKYDRHEQMKQEDWTDLQEALSNLMDTWQTERQPTVGFRPR